MIAMTVALEAVDGNETVNFCEAGNVLLFTV